MSAVVVPNNTWEVPPSPPMEEAVWRAWVLKGLANERRTSARFLKVAKGITFAALVAASVLWSQITTPTEAIAKLIVVGGSVVVLSQAFHQRRYGVTAVFAALVLMFNPVLPVFEFSGQWQRAFVAGTAVLFSVSLLWPRAKVATNG